MNMDKGTIYAKEYQVYTGVQSIKVHYKDDLLLTVTNECMLLGTGTVDYPYNCLSFLNHSDTTYTWTDHDHSKELRYYLTLFKKLLFMRIPEKPHPVHTVQELVYALVYY